MKQFFKIACLLVGVNLASFAHADERIDGLKQMNAEGCTKTIQFEERQPKDAKQVKPYCTCVYDTYYDGFSQKEREKMFSGVIPSKQDGEKLQLRLEAVQEQCRKKIGF